MQNSGHEFESLSTYLYLYEFGTRPIPHTPPLRLSKLRGSLTMQQRHTLEARSRSARREIPRNFQNSKYHYSPPLASILSQLNPAHTHKFSFFSETNFIIILSSWLRSHKVTSSLQVLRLKFCTHLSPTTCMLHVSCIPFHHQG